MADEQQAATPAAADEESNSALLLERLLDEADAIGMMQLVLNAQVPACGFYRRFGFVEEGGEFIEAGLRHRTMRRQTRDESGR